MHGSTTKGIHTLCSNIRATVAHPDRARPLFAASLSPFVTTPHSNVTTCHIRPTSITGLAASNTVSSLTNCPVRFLDFTERINMATLETLRFDNKALQTLPLDDELENFIRQVSGACFSRVEPTPVENPTTVAYSVPAMALIDLGLEELQRKDFPEYLAGNKIFKGAQTAAHCYCGHQFGNFAGQLGDGATMYLGEVLNKKGERWEIQFKGAGLTPYSRTADGRKVLRSSIREFLCSEAMYNLGIPTTRAGSCITSDTRVIRDIFYTGEPIQERATIILRIAESFIRFGSFEICKPTDPLTDRKGPSFGNPQILERLLDYTVETFYPRIWEANSGNKANAYVDFYREIVKRTAHLVAEWQCVGWCHGVLNTDNMSIVGLTIDYGPFGFMDRFDRNYICNGSDDSGRYAFNEQPGICKWNLSKLAENLSHLIPPEEAKALLDTYEGLYEAHYMAKMRKKMGLLNKTLSTDSDLVENFLLMLEESGADMTNSFRLLSQIPIPGAYKGTFAEVTAKVTEEFLSQCCTVKELHHANKPQMDPRQLQMFMMLSQMNPDLLEQLGAGARTIAKEIARIEKFETLKDLTATQKRDIDLEKWQKWLAQYETRLKLEVDGIEDCEAASKERVSVMNANNPRFILRNYIAQNAIDAAETGDFSEVRRVLRFLEKPFSDLVDIEVSKSKGGTSSTTDEGAASMLAEVTNKADDGVPLTGCTGLAYYSKPPLWSMDLKVT